MRTLAPRLALLSSALVLLACHTRVRLDPGRQAYPDAGGPSPDAGNPVADAGSSDGVVDTSTPVWDGGATDGGATDGGGTDGGGTDGGEPDGGSPNVRYAVDTWDDFSALATAEGELKFLLPTETNATNPCWLQDTARYPYHLQFLRELDEYQNLSVEAYQDKVLSRDSREFFAGVLRLFSASKHPVTGQPGILTFTVYTASTPSEVLTTAELAGVSDRLVGCLGSLAPYLVYLPDGNMALAAAEQKATELAEAGITWIHPSQLQGSLDASIYSTGEAYGYVRHIVGGDVTEFGPRDIVVAATAPGELGLIAALITEQGQSSVSHLNLRLREKRIPNAAAPQLFTSGFIDSLEGTLVHVVTAEEGLTVTPARLSDARAFWETQAPVLPAVEFTLDVTAPASLASLAHEDFRAFGTKAANLGELGHALPANHVPHGIAVPFAGYAHHVATNELGSAVSEAVAQAATSSPAAASVVLSALRKQLQQAPIDPVWESQLLDALQAELGDATLDTRLRFRSSTNVEDLPGLSGAGLYNSASGCYADDLDSDDVGPSHCLTEQHRAYYEKELVRLRAKQVTHPELTELEALIADAEQELGEEKSARKALRKVWASLWNDRAFQDRQYYGIDHARVFMGVAVHPSMVGEQLEAVVVTNLEPDSPQPLYRVESQAGEVGVVEPQESDAVSEQVSFRRSQTDVAADVSLITASSFSPNGVSLWTSMQFDTLTTLAFQVQDHFRERVYPELSPLQLDLEVDVTSDGTVMVKQARPYVSGGW